MQAACPALPAGGFWLSKKWLAPLFRGFHSSLAPTARPGSYAEKPLLRKAFCGFAVHAAKSDYSLRGLRPPNPQGFFDRLKGLGSEAFFVCLGPPVHRPSLASTLDPRAGISGTPQGGRRRLAAGGLWPPACQTKWLGRGTLAPAPAICGRFAPCRRPPGWPTAKRLCGPAPPGRRYAPCVLLIPLGRHTGPCPWFSRRIGWPGRGSG